jgi:hypothetical protein
LHYNKISGPEKKNKRSPWMALGHALTRNRTRSAVVMTVWWISDSASGCTIHDRRFLHSLEQCINSRASTKPPWTSWSVQAI